MELHTHFPIRLHAVHRNKLTLLQHINGVDIHKWKRSVRHYSIQPHIAVYVTRLWSIFTSGGSHELEL
jgi:hypothetical protein